MIKKLFCAVLSAILLLLAACGSGGSRATPAGGSAATAGAENMLPSGYPIVKEKITLHAFQWELDNQSIDFANLWFYKQLEEKTNIHVVFEEVKEIDWNTKLNLMFASGNYSDIVMRGELDVEEYGVVQKLVVPLDEYLQECMPNYTARLQLNSAMAAIPASDGKSYHTGFLSAQDINTNGHWFINAQWLKKLGLDTPGTVDELTQVLRAFKTGDPNGNGIADEVPYQATFDDNNTGVYNAFASWGIPENEYYVYIDSTDTVRFSAFTQGYRDCLQWLNLLYGEGLLDRECISQDSNLWGAKLNQDTGGYFTYWRLKNTTLSQEVYRQFQCMIPVAAQGYRPAVSATLEATEFGAAVTVANRHVKETLRWLDAQMETETMMVSQNGPVGDMLRLNGSGKYEIVYIPPNNELYNIVPVICGQFFAPADYHLAIYEMAPHRIEKRDYCRLYAESGVMEYKSFHYLTRLADFTAEQNGKRSKLYMEISKFMTEALTNFITKGVTDASWQAFLERLEHLNVNNYISLYQNAYRQYLETESQ